MADKRLERGVKTLFTQFLNKKRKWDKRVLKGLKWEDPFADVMVYTDKEMESGKTIFGWISGIKKKDKDSNVLLLVTYDGAGYDYFSTEGDYFHGKYREEFANLLEKRYGNKVNLEEYTNWAFQVYNMR